MELLSPVGDFTCLKAAVQNGADSVYLGASNFNARASANNFTYETLEMAIDYAKLRNVKTHLTLNTLITNDEFKSAVELAEHAYRCGIDAIIVQDLGLALYLIKNFPDLPIHASTQMTIHNLECAQTMEKLGFKRAVLARELSIPEIYDICKNTNIEIETFIHGALCVSYSGQCLMSSFIGGRSGNRGKCAQPCRLPYKIKGHSSKPEYILSPKDLCGLDYIPELIDAGVDCFKIEGRMKTPEYVAVVTRIYRKYIDLYLSKQKFEIDENDRNDLLQVFNRGGFSSGHLEASPNTNFVYPVKPNNAGIYIGNVSNYNPSKGYVSFTSKNPLSLGDTISFGNDHKKYTISELMLNKENIPDAKKGQKITIGRMKGKIPLGAKIYKLTSKSLSALAHSSYENNVENTKVLLNANILIKENEPIRLTVTTINSKDSIYNNITVTEKSEITPIKALNKPIDIDRIISQLKKTTSTQFQFNDIHVNLDTNLFIPKISTINELRRKALAEIENKALKNIKREYSKEYLPTINTTPHIDKKDISICFNVLNSNLDYKKLNKFTNAYIPLKYFYDSKYKEIINDISSKANIYICLPVIIKGNYKFLLANYINTAIENYDIHGFVFSNIGNIEYLKFLKKKYKKDFKLVANLNVNVFNNATVKELLNLGTDMVTISPELDKDSINSLCDNYGNYLELFTYGAVPLMNINYCPLGKSNKCYPNCSKECFNFDQKFFLEDRIGFDFRFIPDNIQTVTTIYNSRITSIDSKNFNVKSLRINILDEDIDDINNIIKTTENGKKLKGHNYTTGNLNRKI